MNLGNFSISLAVADIKASREFYEKFGFEVIHGDEKQKWLILKNGETNIGLFEGMFEKNILTFNPGWDSSGKDTGEFVDIRELQASLKKKGVKLETEAEAGEGPASFTALDPDGNPILVDQHRSATKTEGK